MLLALGSLALAVQVLHDTQQAHGRPALSAAGVVIVETETSPSLDDSPAARATRTISVAGSRVRLESDAEGAPILIFDAARETGWVLNRRRQTFVAWTPADLERLARDRAAAATRRRADLERLPPRQRQQMEHLLDVTPASVPPLDFIRTGRDRMNTFECALHRARGPEGRPVDVCTAAWSAVGGTPEEGVALGRMAAFMRALQFGTFDELLLVGTPVDGLPGVIVGRRLHLTDQAARQAQIQQVRRAVLDLDLFTVPAGFRDVSPYR